MSRLLCALAAVVATLALAVTATAAPPERINDFELSVPDGTCPGVDLTFTLRGDIVIHTLSPTELCRQLVEP